MRLRIGTLHLAAILSLSAAGNLLPSIETSLTVHLLDEAGYGVPGVRVIARRLDGAVPMQSTRTDDSGLALLVLPSGRWSVKLLDAPPVLSVRLDHLEAVLPVIVDAAGQATALQIVVAPSSILSGRVVRPDGQGLAGIVIHLAHGQVERRRVATTAADGHFQALAWGFPVIVTPDAELEDWEFEPPSQEIRTSGERVTFVARERLNRLLVSVVDEEQHGLADLPLRAQFLTEGILVREVFRTTNASGQVSLPCGLGEKTLIQVSPPEGSNLLGLEWSGDTPPCGDTLPLTLKGGATLTGTIRSESAPVGALEIRAGSRRTQTDAAGVFKFRGLQSGQLTIQSPPGTALVRADTEDCAPPADVSIPDPPMDIRAEFLLRLSSTICVLPRAVPAAGVSPRVTFEVFRGTCVGPEPLEWERSGSGALCARGVLPGAIRVRGRDREGWLQAQWWRRGSSPEEAEFIALGENDRLEISLDLPAAGKIEIETPGWSPPPAIRWRRDHEQDQEDWLPLDVLGSPTIMGSGNKVLVGGIPPGRYHLLLSSDLHEHSVPFEVVTGQVTRLTVPLRPAPPRVSSD